MKLIIKGEIENKPKLIVTERGNLKAAVSIKDDGQFVRVSTYDTNLMNVILHLKANEVNVVKGNNVGSFFFLLMFPFRRTKTQCLQ